MQIVRRDRALLARSDAAGERQGRDESCSADQLMRSEGPYLVREDADATAARGPQHSRNPGASGQVDECEKRDDAEIGWRPSVFIGYGRLVYALGVDAIGQSRRLPHAASA
jgi:hypothetical protein